MFRKIIFGALVLSSMLTLSACGKSPKITEPTQTNQTATSSTPTSQITTSAVATASDNTTSKALVKHLMKAMSSALVVANQITEGSTGKPKFTQKHITCFTTKYNEQLEAKTQEYLQSKLTTDELRQLNDYYASDLGKKQIAMFEQAMADVTGDESVDVSADMPSETDLEAIQEFAQSPLGQKFQKILKDKQAFRPFIEPVVLKKEKACNMPK